MRSRIIRPEFWNDEKLASVSRDARLLFAGLWTTSDDYGVSKGHLNWVKSQIFPYDDIKMSDFSRWIDELKNIGVIIPFEANDEKFLYIRNFETHQKVDHPSNVRNPEPPEDILERLANDSRMTRGKFPLLTLTETETETETETIIIKPDQKKQLEKKKGIMRERFDTFWSAYPKKVAKQKSMISFFKISPDENLLKVILSSIEFFKKTEDWKKQSGQFIPHPTTWLNGKRWEDEQKVYRESSTRRPHDHHPSMHDEDLRRQMAGLPLMTSDEIRAWDEQAYAKDAKNGI